MESLDYPNQVSFITLTYDETNVPRTAKGVPTVRIADLSAFMKRLRFNTKAKIRYFGHTEYGEPPTYRPHIHILLFGLDYLNYLPIKNWKPEKDDQKRLDENKTDWRRYGPFELEILRAWQCRGQIVVTPGDQNRIKYVSEHQMKGLVDTRKLLPGQEPQKARMSRQPAIGTAAILRLAQRMKKHGIYPEDMGAELLVEDPQEIDVRSLSYQKSSRPGVVTNTGGQRKSQRNKKGYPLGRVLKARLVDALGGDNRDSFDKEIAQYQALTVGDGPRDPIEDRKIKRMQREKLARIQKRRQAF